MVVNLSYCRKKKDGQYINTSQTGFRVRGRMDGLCVGLKIAHLRPRGTGKEKEGHSSPAFSFSSLWGPFESQFQRDAGILSHQQSNSSRPTVRSRKPLAPRARPIIAVAGECSERPAAYNCLPSLGQLGAVRGQLGGS